MELSSPPACLPETPAPRILPVILAALVSPSDDPRGFRRYPTPMEVGVRLDADPMTHQKCLSRHEGSASTLINYRSVFASDLSLTGLYFISALPYRVGVRLEVCVPLPGQTLHLLGIVCRLDTPARTDLGNLETAFGCGVDFRYRETSARSRRALMEFLVRRAIPN